MSASTGPIVAAGAVTAFNAIILQGRPPATQARTAVGTLVAAGGLFLAEQVAPKAAVAFAWLVFAGVLLVRVDATTPSPLETFVAWYRKE